MEEDKKKTAEERFEAKEGNSLMNMIIGKTFARHANLTEDEYLKEIGFENSGKTEDEAIRIAILNLLVTTTNELLRAKEQFRLASSLMKLYLSDESIAEEKKGE